MNCCSIIKNQEVSAQSPQTLDCSKAIKISYETSYHIFMVQPVPKRFKNGFKWFRACLLDQFKAFLKKWNQLQYTNTFLPNFFLNIN